MSNRTTRPSDELSQIIGRAAKRGRQITSLDFERMCNENRRLYQYPAQFEAIHMAALFDPDLFYCHFWIWDDDRGRENLRLSPQVVEARMKLSYDMRARLASVSHGLALYKDSLEQISSSICPIEADRLAADELGDLLSGIRDSVTHLTEIHSDYLATDIFSLIELRRREALRHRRWMTLDPIRIDREMRQLKYLKSWKRPKEGFIKAPQAAWRTAGFEGVVRNICCIIDECGCNKRCANDVSELLSALKASTFVMSRAAAARPAEYAFAYVSTIARCALQAFEGGGM